MPTRSVGVMEPLKRGDSRLATEGAWYTSLLFVAAVFSLVAVRAAMAGRTPGQGPIQRLHTNPADVSGINAGTAVPTVRRFFRRHAQGLAG